MEIGVSSEQVLLEWDKFYNWSYKFNSSNERLEQLKPLSNILRKYGWYNNEFNNGTSFIEHLEMTTRLRMYNELKQINKNIK